LSQTRRQFFRDCALGLGSLGLLSLLDQRALAQPPASAARADPMSPRPPHFAPRAKNIIYLFMNGAPSQLDLLDPKPRLAELNGQPCPDSFTHGDRFAFIKGTPKILGSPYKFAKCGQSGAEISELLPHLQTVADDIAIVR